MKTKITLLILSFNQHHKILAQNEQDLETLSIFSELVKSKNYNAAYTPWMELRNRNPKFNKAIFVYGERILKIKLTILKAMKKLAL